MERVDCVELSQVNFGARESDRLFVKRKFCET